MDNGISTQRYIFGILALLVIVFVTVFYVCIAWRFVRYVGVVEGVCMVFLRGIDSHPYAPHTNTTRRRRRTRAIAMEAALEEQRRQKELLELVERACSVPSNVILAQQKASVVSVTSSKLETTSSCSSAQSADEVVMPGAKSSKLYLSQECPVCLEDVADVEAWRAFRCGHGICYTCLATAVKHATSALDIKCPICREHVLDVPQEQEAGGSGDGALQGGAQVQVGDDVQSSPVVGGGIPEVVDGGIPEAGSSEAVVGGVGNASPQGVTHDAPPRANV